MNLFPPPQVIPTEVFVELRAEHGTMWRAGLPVAGHALYSHQD